MGPLFRQIFDMTVKNVIRPSNNKLKQINDRIDAIKVKEKLDKSIDTTEKMMTVLDISGNTYHDFVVALMLVDKYCPA